MPTYQTELRICKVCGISYDAWVLLSSNTFSQSIESINYEMRRHSYWLCDSCWDNNQIKTSHELEVYLPNESDFEKQKNFEKMNAMARRNEAVRYGGYFEVLKEYMVDTTMYTKYLIELFNCLSAEILAQNKPYKLYIDSNEFDLDYVWGKQTIGYLFDPIQKGPNISISYDLTTYTGNIFHMFPKIIVDSGFHFMIRHNRNTEVSKSIFGHGIQWKIDIELHKKICELMKNHYSWMENDFIDNEIMYLQHIYFSQNLIEDLIKVFDKYYLVFGKAFERLRLMSLKQKYNFTVDENFKIIEGSKKLGMRLFDEPFTDKHDW